jgi:hypothetical protein
MKLKITDQSLEGFFRKGAMKFARDGVCCPESRVMAGVFVLFAGISKTCDYHNG